MVAVNTYVDNSALVDQYNRDLTAADGQLPTEEVDSSFGDFDTFLTLLTVQLQNQDPLDPMDTAAFTDQLVSFAMLEQNIASNEYLEKMTEATDYSAQSLAISYISKDALAPGDVVASPPEGGATVFSYTIDGVAYSSVVEIVDEEGTTVRVLEGDTAYGNNDVLWDGLDSDGNPVEAGLFKVYVSSVDSEGDSIATNTYTYGRVQAVEGEGENVNLILSDGRQVSLEEIILVREAASLTDGDTTTG